MQKQFRFQSKDTFLITCAIVLVVALLLKFFWPLFFFDVPLGYDPGFYRYLFVRHSLGFPPFAIADMEPWAHGHPLGLFFFTTILLRVGFPVDWLIGWVWNLFPVLLAASLAYVTAQRHGRVVGVLVLLAALLSVSYFDGFSGMYWKTYASLMWCVWTYHLLERRSWWSIVTGMFCVATHHQTGLLFGLAVGSWLVLPLLPFSISTHSFPLRTQKGSRRDFLIFLLCSSLIFLLGILWYLPVLQDAVLMHLPTLFANDSSATGSFPPPSFFLRTSGILLALGTYGFVQNIRGERWTLWQLSVIWSFLFVALRLFFYKRFFLQLDFFLLPFAAYGLQDLWHQSARQFRGLIGALLVLQLFFMQQAIVVSAPLVEKETLTAVRQIRRTYPNSTYVIGLENESAVVLRGWLPFHRVGGPGLFQITWSYPQWEAFLVGAAEDRQALLRSLQAPAIVFVTPLFRDYYGEYADVFLRDPCFAATDSPYIYHVTCTDFPIVP